MSWYHVVLAVAAGAIFDTGERLEMNIQGSDKLDAAIRAEQQADSQLEDQAIKYTHTIDVKPMAEHAVGMALAA